MARLKTRIIKAVKPVQQRFISNPPNHYRKDNRIKKLPKPAVKYEEIDEITLGEQSTLKRDAEKYESIIVTNSKGKKYRVVVPASYASSVPKVWKWDYRRLRVAEMIAQGKPISHIVADPQVGVKARLTIYGWMEHPEFREHVDALVAETGFASQRERIAGLSRMTQKLFDKLMHEINDIKLTEKSVSAILTGIYQGMKQLAQEKGEFIERQNVMQQTRLTWVLAGKDMKAQEMMSSKSEEERKCLKAEFDKLGDEIIRGLTDNIKHLH